MDIANTVLVGHVRGRTFSVKRLKQWVQEIWGGVFFDLPVVHVLPRGWFSLQFSKESYTNLVLGRCWHIEMALVLLKRWSPLFDPEREQLGARPIWVRLPGLPLPFWAEEVFIRIGNSLGTYLDYDRTYIESGNRTLARILVHLDTCEGLEEQITLQWGRCIRVQLLDYEGVPFRCRRCHKVGHLAKNCPLNKKAEDTPRGTPAPTRTASPITSHTPSAGPPPPTSSPVVDLGHRQPSPPLTRARSAAEAGTVSGSLNPPLLSSFDVMHVNGSSPQPSMIHCALTSSPHICNTEPIISTSSPAASSYLPPLEPSPPHSYFLRSRNPVKEPSDRHSGLGIVIPEGGSLTTRGRKSHLSKAIKQAGAEVVSGRQSTIDGVLRAGHTPRGVPP